MSVSSSLEMSVVQAPIQTVGEIYRLVWAAVANKRPIEAIYHGRPRLFCPHRLGRNQRGQLRVLCYQYGGESESGLQPAGSPANWRCVALEQLSRVNYSTMVGGRRRTIRALPPAWRKPILTPKIIRSAPHKKDTEEVGPVAVGQERFSRSQ